MGEVPRHAKDLPKCLSSCAVSAEDLEPGLSDGQLLQVGRDVAVEVVHTPGHSAGSICLSVRGRSELRVGTPPASQPPLGGGETPLPHGRPAAAGPNARADGGVGREVGCGVGTEDGCGVGTGNGCRMGSGDGWRVGSGDGFGVGTADG